MDSRHLTKPRFLGRNLWEKGSSTKEEIRPPHLLPYPAYLSSMPTTKTIEKPGMLIHGYLSRTLASPCINLLNHHVARCLSRHGGTKIKHKYTILVTWIMAKVKPGSWSCWGFPASQAINWCVCVCQCCSQAQKQESLRDYFDGPLSLYQQAVGYRSSI